MTPSGWAEGKVLEVGEGFKRKSEAEKWGKNALKRLRVPGRTNARYFKVGPAY